MTKRFSLGIDLGTTNCAIALSDLEADQTEVLQVTQNNVANASTPGFVKHRQTLLAMPFDPAGGKLTS